MVENQVNFDPYMFSVIPISVVLHSYLFWLIEPLSFHSHQSAPAQPNSQFYKNPSSSHPTAFSPQITANQATRALPFQGSTNTHATHTATASSNDWIPISQPSGLPVSTSHSQLSTSRPAISNSPIFQETASNFDAFTFNNIKSTEGNTFKPGYMWYAFSVMLK